jgi:hypothetical protein
MKLNEVISTLAIASGLDATDTALLQAMESTKNIEIADALAAKMTSPRMTLEAAKHDPDLARHFKQQALNPLDVEIETEALEAKLSPDKVLALRGERNTYEKRRMLNRFMREEAANAEAPKGARTSEEVERLNAELAKEKEEKALIQKQAAEEKKQIRVQMELEKIFGSYLDNDRLNFAKDMNPEIKLRTAQLTVEAWQKKEGVTFDVSDDGRVVATKEGLQYHDPLTNKPVTPAEYVRSKFIADKILKETATPPKMQPQRSNTVVSDGTQQLTVSENFSRRAEDAKRFLNASGFPQH